MSDKDIIDGYASELAKFGQELPEDKSEDTEPKEPKKEPEETPAEKVPEKEPDQEPEQKPERVGRQLSEKYKEKKAELRTERELREQVEKERDELKGKLDALNGANTAEEKQEAQDEIDQFLSKHQQWDKNAIGDLLAIAEQRLASHQPKPDESLQRDLNEFRQWKSQNQQVIEKQMFEDEFAKTLPAIKELFPSANDEELNAIKVTVDKVSHTKDWHDKDLEYVVFKHRNELSALVTPRKRGMESKGRTASESTPSEFDASADLSSMTPKQRAEWSKDYERMTSQKRGIYTDQNGKKIIV